MELPFHDQNLVRTRGKPSVQTAGGNGKKIIRGPNYTFVPKGCSRNDNLKGLSVLKVKKNYNKNRNRQENPIRPAWQIHTDARNIISVLKIGVHEIFVFF